MYRLVIPVVFVLALVVAFASAPTPRSGARSAPLAAAANATPDGLCAPGTPAAWEAADVRPHELLFADVVPAAEQDPSEPLPVRELYLVSITLPPGHCMPFTAGGNMKDGAIVMIVQQGRVQYLWQPLPGTTPVVERGDMFELIEPLPSGTPTTLYPGDWVTHDQEIEFSYANVGGDSAIIWKAVWAVVPGGGCGGGCK